MVQSWGAKVHEARLPDVLTSSKMGCDLSTGQFIYNTIFSVMNSW